MFPYVRFVHLLAAAVWMGGLITLSVLVVALRKAGADSSILRAAARRFAWVSWTAMGVAILTGVGQVVLMHMPWAYGRLHVKVGFVALAVVLTLVHQLTVKKSSPAARGLVHGLMLLASLGIFGAAVALGT